MCAITKINHALPWWYNLQLRLLDPLKQHVVLGVRIDGDVVQRIKLTGTMEHILVHLTISTTKTAVEYPIVEAPCIDEANSVRPDLLQQLHDGIRPGKHDLMLGTCSAGIELAGLLLERVQGVKTEKLHQHVDGVVVDMVAVCDGLQRGEVVLDDHPLGVRFGEAVEVDEQVVPRLLLDVAVLVRFECEEGYAPCEGVNEVLVGSDDVEGAADLTAGLELGQDLGCVVGGTLAVEDGAGGLEKVAGYLLREHVVVTLPGECGKVVGIPRADTAVVC
jgi:hypothetical protein